MSRSKTRLRLGSWPPDAKLQMSLATGGLLFQSDPGRPSSSSPETRCWNAKLETAPARGCLIGSGKMRGAGPTSSRLPGEGTRCAEASWSQRCCCSAAGRGELSVTGARSLFSGSVVSARPSVVTVAGRPGVGSHDLAQWGKRGRLQTTASKSEKDELACERRRLGEQGYDRQRADVHRLRQPRMSRAAQGNESHPDVGTAVLAAGMSHPTLSFGKALALVSAAAGWQGGDPRSREGTRSAAAGPG